MRAQVRLLEVQRADISGSSAVVRYQGGGGGHNDMCGAMVGRANYAASQESPGGAWSAVPW